MSLSSVECQNEIPIGEGSFQCCPPVIVYDFTGPRYTVLSTQSRRKEATNDD